VTYFILTGKFFFEFADHHFLTAESKAPVANFFFAKFADHHFLTAESKAPVAAANVYLKVGGYITSLCL